jgi:hypothetical protein
MGRKRYFPAWLRLPVLGTAGAFERRDASAGRPVIATVASWPAAAPALSPDNRTFSQAAQMIISLTMGDAGIHDRAVSTCHEKTSKSND